MTIPGFGQLFSGDRASGREWRPHEVQARAALIPVDNPKCREPWLIKRRSVDVGCGAAVQVSSKFFMFDLKKNILIH